METGKVEETLALGRRLGRLAGANQVIALDGQLGAGKTQLVRGIAQGAKVADLGLVSSPTYVICQIYPRDGAEPGSRTVFHLDAYRTQGAEDFAAVGFDELLGQEGIVVIEWAARISGLLPADHLAIAIEVVDENRRSWEFTAGGPQSQRLLDALVG